jgi:hypothetical protein
MNLILPNKIRTVPVGQALSYTIQRALKAIDWLNENEIERQRKYNAREEASTVSLRSRILTDAISVYVSTLAGCGQGYSLLRSYPKHPFVEKFITLPIVKKCKLNRNNRSAHEASSYGHFVSSKEILESDLTSWLDAALYFINLGPQAYEA